MTRAFRGTKFTMRRFTILAQGEGLPDHAIQQPDAAQYAIDYLDLDEQQQKLLPALYRMTGVKRRHSVVLDDVDGDKTMQHFFPKASSKEDRGPSIGDRMKCYEEEAPKLAKKSTKEALEKSGVSADEITHLITVSCSGFGTPGVDIHLIDYLGLRRTVERVHVGFMACHGALNAIKVAQGIAESNPDAVILLCAVETCSLHYHYPWDAERVVANALFADGSAAIVGRGLEAEDGGDAWHVRATGSCLIPESGEGIKWQIRDHGFEIGLSPKVPDLIEGSLKPWTEEWLGEHGYTIDDIKTWAVHPGGPRILSASAKALGLEKERLAVSREVLQQFGNMSSPTILFIVNRLREREAETPCVALAFGPGLMAEAVLFEG